MPKFCAWGAAVFTGMTSKTACRGVQGHSAAGHPAPDDQHVESLCTQAVQRLLAIEGDWRRHPIHATDRGAEPALACPPRARRPKSARQGQQIRIFIV